MTDQVRMIHPAAGVPGPPPATDALDPPPGPPPGTVPGDPGAVLEAPPAPPAPPPVPGVPPAPGEAPEPGPPAPPAPGPGGAVGPVPAAAAGIGDRVGARRTAAAGGDSRPVPARCGGDREGIAGEDGVVTCGALPDRPAVRQAASYSRGILGESPGTRTAGALVCREVRRCRAGLPGALDDQRSGEDVQRAQPRPACPGEGDGLHAAPSPAPRQRERGLSSGLAVRPQEELRARERRGASHLRQGPGESGPP